MKGVCLGVSCFFYRKWNQKCSWCQYCCPTRWPKSAAIFSRIGRAFLRETTFLRRSTMWRAHEIVASFARTTPPARTSPTTTPRLPLRWHRPVFFSPPALPRTSTAEAVSLARETATPDVRSQRLVEQSGSVRTTTPLPLVPRSVSSRAAPRWSSPRASLATSGTLTSTRGSSNVHVVTLLQVRLLCLALQNLVHWTPPIRGELSAGVISVTWFLVMFFIIPIIRQTCGDKNFKTQCFQGEWTDDLSEVCR